MQRPAADVTGMDMLKHMGTGGCLNDHRGGRRHRFMESSDINVAFREIFRPLRANIRRGMTIEGQLYGFELDSCVPGQLLGAAWIPPATRGVHSPAELADPARRKAVFDSLLAEQRSESLFAYVNESPAGRRPALLRVELASADGRFVAEHPLRPGRGWHARELVEAPSRRLARA